MLLKVETPDRKLRVLFSFRLGPLVLGSGGMISVYALLQERDFWYLPFIAAAVAATIEIIGATPPQAAAPRKNPADDWPDVDD